MTRLTHVFVETNFLIDALRPFPTPSAMNLLARHGVDVTLHVPWCAFTEARRTLVEVGREDLRFVDGCGRFIRSLRLTGNLTAEREQEVQGFIRDARQKRVDFLNDYLTDLDAQRLRLAVILPDQAVVDKTVDVFRRKQLKPFDEMVLGCVLAEAERLFNTGERGMYFCNTNTKDFEPTVGNGLADAYAAVDLTYKGDFDV